MTEPALALPRRGLGAPLVALALEGALLLSWSAGFLGIRFSSDHAPIFLILLWRSLGSGLLLLPFALTLGPRLRWRDWPPQMLFGTLAMAGYLSGFALAIGEGVPTGLVALISDMLPLTVALLSWPMLGQRLTRGQWLGTGLGLGGVVVASGGALGGGEAPLWAYGLPVLGTLSFALSTLLQTRSAAGALPVHQSLCLQCLTAAAIFAVAAWIEGGVAPVPTAGFVGGILWLVLVATLGSWSLYYLALRRSSPARVTAVLYLSPPVTALWAWAVFGEPLSWALAAGMALSLAGIVVFARSGGRTGP